MKYLLEISYQNKGIMKLLYKKGEREDIKNWRPITLLNTDYKIIANVLANRIQSKGICTWT